MLCALQNLSITSLLQPGSKLFYVSTECKFIQKIYDRHGTAICAHPEPFCNDEQKIPVALQLDEDLMIQGVARLSFFFGPDQYCWAQEFCRFYDARISWDGCDSMKGTDNAECFALLIQTYKINCTAKSECPWKSKTPRMP